jgi:hypothetical protein
LDWRKWAFLPVVPGLDSGRGQDLAGLADLVSVCILEK